VKTHPKIQLIVTEIITSRVIHELQAGLIDGAILATPLHEPGLHEHSLYYERFFAYVSGKEPAYRLKSLSALDIQAERLWLLEEGHCFRSQIIHYCDLRKQSPQEGGSGFVYEAGSIETLIRLVDRYDGMTIIPEMAVAYLKPEQEKQLRPFSDPVPVREISLVTREDFLRYRMIRAFQEAAAAVLPPDMTSGELRRFIVDI
jgi:LysR family hydrogen peroxide-inducible transcriptional activator